MNRAWQALTQEETLEPELAICDAHHHLWHGGPDRRERYLFDDWLLDVNGSGHKIVSTVFAECRSMYRQDGPQAFRSIGETEFANGIAAMSASGGYGPTRAAAGIVGHVELTLGEALEPVVQAHLRASPRLRGMRYSTCWDARADELSLWQSAPRGLLYDPRVRAGLACLERHGLSFDAWMLFPQLADLVDLARDMPGLRIVMGHLGGLVGIGPYADHDAVFDAWRRHITLLARCPNVYMKLGGIGVKRLGFGWHERERPASSIEIAAAARRYVLHCVEQFGAERCMFESNFPVDGTAAAYNVLWNAYKRATETCSAAERAELFHGTAERAYRLEPERVTAPSPSSSE
jgi:predicted TIM-barrel fold metal-dependent hydrolase